MDKVAEFYARWFENKPAQEYSAAEAASEELAQTRKTGSRDRKSKPAETYNSTMKDNSEPEEDQGVETDYQILRPMEA